MKRIIIPLSTSPHYQTAAADSPTSSSVKPTLLPLSNIGVDMIPIEDFDGNSSDSQLIRDFMIPYLKDLYRDIAMRSLEP